MARISIFNKRLSNNKFSFVKTVICVTCSWVECHASGYLRMRVTQSTTTETRALIYPSHPVSVSLSLSLNVIYLISDNSISLGSRLPLIRVMSFIIRLIHVGEERKSSGFLFPRSEFHFPSDGNAFITRNRDDTKFQLPIREHRGGHYWGEIGRTVFRLER